MPFNTTPFIAFANGESRRFMPEYAEMGTPQSQADFRYVARQAGGTSGGIDSAAAFSFAPFPPQGPGLAKRNPTCWTINTLLNDGRVKKAFDQAWLDTRKSGEEHGGWIFADINSGDLFIYRASEGVTVNGTPQMPNEPKELGELRRKLNQSDPKRRQVLLASFHTHPLNTDYPSRADRESQLYRDGAGVIIHDLGKYAAHGSMGKWSGPFDVRLDRCLPFSSP